VVVVLEVPLVADVSVVTDVSVVVPVADVSVVVSVPLVSVRVVSVIVPLSVTVVDDVSVVTLVSVTVESSFLQETKAARQTTSSTRIVFFIVILSMIVDVFRNSNKSFLVNLGVPVFTSFECSMMFPSGKNVVLLSGGARPRATGSNRGARSMNAPRKGGAFSVA
jgi:hypothetical protein